MSYILHIETATKNCSVAIGKSGSLVALKELYAENFSHSEQLHVFIQKALQEANIEMEALDAVAVSKGPGSYTGLRIGVAAAKGICFALELPLIGINSLQILAEKYSALEKALLFPMFDARRMAVYVMVLDENKQLVKPTFNEVITANSFEACPRSFMYVKSMPN